MVYNTSPVASEIVSENNGFIKVILIHSPTAMSTVYMLQRLHLEVLRVDVDEGADGAEFMVEVTKRTASSQRHLRQMGLSYMEG